MYAAYAGGGVLDMTVTTTLRLEGVISAKGEASTTASGGSGGSIRIQTYEMEGSGSVQVGLWFHPLCLTHIFFYHQAAYRKHYNHVHLD